MALHVLVVNDGRLDRECLAAQLEANGCQAQTAWDLQSMLSAVDAHRPDVILLNIDTENHSVLLQVSLDLDSGPKVIVFGLDGDRGSEIIACAEAGVAGLHLRSESFGHLLEILRTAGEGQARCSPEVSAILMSRVYAFAANQNPDSSTESLTAREREVLHLITRGMTNQQIANRLSLTLHTVKNHVHNLLTKLGVGSRAEAVAVARAAGYTNR